MGMAKYHEDNLRIYEDRLFLSRTSVYPGAHTHSIDSVPSMKYSIVCPICKTPFSRDSLLVDHVYQAHGHVRELVFLNNKQVLSNTITVNHVSSLKLYSFRESPSTVQVIDGMENHYTIRIKAGVQEHNILDLTNGTTFSVLRINNITHPVCIQHRIDISLVTTDSILSRKYSSYLFDEQVSEELLFPEGYLTYLKLLIFEGSDTDPIIDKLLSMHLNESPILKEILTYHFLYKGDAASIHDVTDPTLCKAIRAILSGNLSEAELLLHCITYKKNDYHGCAAAIYMLKGESLQFEYHIAKYRSFGFLGILVEALQRLHMQDSLNAPVLPRKSRGEFKLFESYPLLHALLEFDLSIRGITPISQSSCQLLWHLTPLVGIQYYRTLKDSSSRIAFLERIKMAYPNSLLLKELAARSDEYISDIHFRVADGELYLQALQKYNARRRIPFSDNFLRSLPHDDQITITPLGGSHSVGASCFIISYRSYHVMLDCGIDPKRSGGDTYPHLDAWNHLIDAIIITHAHIDHSGGLPKAHMMWPDARLLCTAPTKTMLRYLYADMARVNTGISTGFEIEYATIEREAMDDTLDSLNSIDIGKWISISPDIALRFHAAGHIIGAVMVELRIKEHTIVYTGDCCSFDQALASPYSMNTLPTDIDYLITESTYLGSRHIDAKQQRIDIENAILDSVRSGRGLLLPSSAFGRSQELACIVGEMHLAGLLPDSIPLYIAGMTIPACTQIIPHLNERYQTVIGLFREYDGVSTPDTNSIVIAGSASMSKRSASYRIARAWSSMSASFDIITNGYIDDSIRHDIGITPHSIRRFSLSNHSDTLGILDMIEHTTPKILSFVHRGTNVDRNLQQCIEDLRKRFANDLIYRDLSDGTAEHIFDIYEWLAKGE